MGDTTELAARYLAALGGTAEIQQFEISGISLGLPIEFGFGGIDPSPYVIPAPVAGSSAADVVIAFVDMINDLGSGGVIPGVSADVDGAIPTRFTITSTVGSFDLWVATISGAPCIVTGNTVGCNVSPFIVDVPFLPTAPQFLRGDSNVDSSVDVADAIFLLGALFPGLVLRTKSLRDGADATTMAN